MDRSQVKSSLWGGFEAEKGLNNNNNCINTLTSLPSFLPTKKRTKGFRAICRGWCGVVLVMGLKRKEKGLEEKN